LNWDTGAVSLLNLPEESEDEHEELLIRTPSRDKNLIINKWLLRLEKLYEILWEFLVARQHAF
jgi:hypothetical protein